MTRSTISSHHPGSVSVELDAGTYRIYVDGQVVNASQCDPDDNFGEVKRMGLQLVPPEGVLDADIIRPRVTTACDGGIDRTGPHAVSVSEFVVERDGTYDLTAAEQPPSTVRDQPVTVYLADASHRYAKFGVGLGGTLLGLPLLLSALFPDRGRFGKR